jgi:hypothetical protein
LKNNRTLDYEDNSIDVDRIDSKDSNCFSNIDKALLPLKEKREGFNSLDPPPRSSAV